MRTECVKWPGHPPALLPGMPLSPACSGAAFLPWLSGANYCTLSVVSEHGAWPWGGMIAGSLVSGKFPSVVRGTELSPERSRCR